MPCVCVCPVCVCALCVCVPCVCVLCGSPSVNHSLLYCHNSARFYVEVAFVELFCTQTVHLGPGLYNYYGETFSIDGHYVKVPLYSCTIELKTMWEC